MARRIVFCGNNGLPIGPSDLQRVRRLDKINGSTQRPPNGPLLPRIDIRAPVSNRNPSLSWQEHEPPGRGFFSTIKVLRPLRAAMAPAAEPPMPVPMTTASKSLPLADALLETSAAGPSGLGSSAGGLAREAHPRAPIPMAAIPETLMKSLREMLSWAKDLHPIHTPHRGPAAQPY